MQDAILQSLHTVFKSSIYSKVVKAIREYQLIDAGDRIAVCISGGKDSMLLAKVLQSLQQYGKTPFSLRFLAMDPGYSVDNRKRLEKNAVRAQIPLEIFETNVFQVANHHAKKPCFLCATLRRGSLYAKAQEMGCNKIALGHHFDDVAETIVMAMLYGGQIQTMLPRLRAEHYPTIELIRPLYHVHEKTILQWKAHCGFTFLDCACRVAEKRLDGEGSKRAEVKKLLEALSQTNPQIRQNVVNSVKNINLKRVMGYHLDETQGSFLDFLQQKETI